jgi:hypothetical protein
MTSPTYGSQIHRLRPASERLGKKKVKEESLDKPIQSMITQIKSRAKKY